MQYIHDIQNNFPKYTHPAMLFVGDGIVVDCLTTSPIIQSTEITKVTSLLNIEIHAAYLDVDIIIIRCKPSNKTQTYNTLESNFYIHIIRDFLADRDIKIQKQILRAIHWLKWDARMQYCNKCGSELDKVYSAIEKLCCICKSSFFPNLFPAVVVLIKKEDEVLLARSSHFNRGVYAGIAGFVDIAETAEDAAHREVMEEVGLEISELEYFGTQSWGFSGSFMVAFKAQYLRGELKIDTNEIEDARWFHINNLPTLPAQPSIVRELILSQCALRN